jgi:hypothetical protein
MSDLDTIKERLARAREVAEELGADVKIEVDAICGVLDEVLGGLGQGCDLDQIYTILKLRGFTVHRRDDTEVHVEPGRHDIETLLVIEPSDPHLSQGVTMRFTNGKLEWIATTT